MAIVLYGTDGFAAVPSYSGGVVYDSKRNQIAKFNKGGDAYHFKNFIQAVRSRNHLELNGDVLEGHLSSALCHLANISYRLGQPASGEEVAERLSSDDENWETFERFRDHLWYNDVPIRDAKIVGFGRSLKIDPKGETFIAESATEDAEALLTRPYRAPFVIPSAKDV